MLGYFSKAETEECDQIKLSLLDKFGMQMSGFDKYFLEMSAHCLLKIDFKDSSRGKKSQNLAFLGYFPEAKTEECNQKHWSACNRFCIIIPCLTTYFRE